MLRKSIGSKEGIMKLLRRLSRLLQAKPTCRLPWTDLKTTKRLTIKMKMRISISRSYRMGKKRIRC